MTNEPNGNKEQSGKGRIVYEREALLQFRTNARPIPKMQIPVDLIRSKKPNSPSDFVSPDRKRGGGTPTSRNENSQSPRDDSISLRPHSGNFASGCTPNLSPNNGPFLSRFHPQDEQPKPFFDRDTSRNQFRYPPGRLDPQERGRGRDGRGREERPMRDLENERPRDARDRDGLGRDQDRNFRGPGSRALPTDNGRRSYGQGYNSWGADESSDWNRRRPNEQSHYRRDYNSRDRRSSGMEQEPEWFSEGPTTNNDTIELRGFHDDDRQEQPKARNESAKKDQKATFGAGDEKIELGSEGHGKNSPKPENSGMSLDKIFEMDQISNLLTNGLLEHEQPSGSSRFSQLFQRYSDSSRQELNGVKRSSPVDEVIKPSADGAMREKQPDENVKTKAARDIEAALRNILLAKPPEEQEEAKEDIQAFKKLLDQIVVKGGNRTESPQNSQAPKPPYSPMSDAFARIAKLDPADQPKPRPDVQAFFSSFFARALNPDAAATSSQPQPSQVPRRMPQNIAQQQRPIRPPNLQLDGFRPNPAALPQFAQRNPIHGLAEQMKFQQHQRPTFSAFEVLNLLPLEMQSIVLGARIGPEFMKRPDVIQIINAMNSGDVVLNDIIQQLGAPHNPNKPVLAGVLKLGLNGVIPIPGLVNAPIGHAAWQVPKFQPPQSYAPHPHYAPQAHFPMHHHNHAPPPMHPTQGNPHGPHHGQPNFNGGHPGF